METNKITTTKLEKAMKLFAGIDFTKQLMVMLKSVCTDYKCQFDDSEIMCLTAEAVEDMANDIIRYGRVFENWSEIESGSMIMTHTFSGSH